MSELCSRQILIRLAAGVALVVTTGCAIHQRDEIATYRQFIDGNKPAPVNVAPGKTVTLTDALELTNQNDEQLSLQGESYLQSLINKDKIWANFEPTLSLGGGYSFNQSSSHIAGRVNQSNSLSASSGVNLFNGFIDYNNLKSATASIEQQKQLVFDLQQTVLLDAANAYYQVLSSEKSVEVLLNSISVQQKNVDYVQREMDVGVGTTLAVAQAQAQLSQTKVSLFSAQNDVRNTREALAFLLNAKVQENPLLDDYQPPDQVSSVDEWIAKGTVNRQDLLASQSSVLAARDEVDAAIGQYYPSISLSLNYLLARSVDPSSGPWSAAFSLNLPIFTGGTIHANIRDAWSRFRQAVLSLSQLRRQIIENITIAYNGLMLARQEVLELNIELAAARKAYENSVATQRVGKATPLDVLVAEDTMLSSELQLRNEEFTAKTAYLNLLRMVGQLQLTVAAASTRPSTMPTTMPASMPTSMPTSMPVATGINGPTLSNP